MWLLHKTFVVLTYILDNALDKVSLKLCLAVLVLFCFSLGTSLCTLSLLFRIYVSDAWVLSSSDKADRQLIVRLFQKTVNNSNLAWLSCV